MSRRSIARLLCTLLIGSVATLPGLGCQTGVDEQLALVSLGDSCQLNSDCQSPLKCVFQRCHQQCESTRDCKGGARCVDGAATHNVCQLPDERGCTVGACTGSQLCGVDAQCRDGCQSDGDCLGEQVCAGGSCAEPKELDENGELPRSGERPEWAPVPCAYDSDCEGSELCGKGGTCRARCVLDAECARGQSCQDGACRSDEAECRYDSDCSVDQLCDQGSCRRAAQPPTPECEADRDCATLGQRCDAGRCRCECATANDCDRGQACSDACQCVPDLIVHGNLYIQNLAQFAELRNVVEVTGQLSLSLSGDLSAELHLPNLRRVANIYANSEHGDPFRVVFDALTDVAGRAECNVSCSFPALETAGELQLAGDGELSLPALTTATTLRATKATLTALHVPALHTLEVLDLASTSVTQVELPLVTSLRELYLSGNALLTHVNLSGTNITDRVSINNNDALEEIDLRGLTATKDPLTGLPTPVSVVEIVQDQRLSSLLLPNLDHAKLIVLNVLPVLTSVNLQRLTTVASINVHASNKALALSLPELVEGTVDVSGSLASIALPELSKATGIAVFRSGLVELSLPSLTSLDNLSVDDNPELQRLSLPQVSETSYFMVNNAPKLSQLNVDALTQAKITLMLSNTGLTDLYALDPDTLPLHGSLIGGGSLTIMDNAQLPSCFVDLLETHLRARGWTSAMNNQNNLDAPGACP